MPLRQRVFIAGPNAAGKSNLLDAFRFLRDITSPGGGLEKAVLLDEGIASDETLLLRPDSNGTQVEVAAADAEIRLLLEAGVSMGNAVLPRTAPKGEEQLALMFGD